MESLIYYKGENVKKTIANISLNKIGIRSKDEDKSINKAKVTKRNRTQLEDHK